MFILSFSIFFVCHAVILLIPCVVPLWDSTAAHSPSDKELNPSYKEDARFSGRCTLEYNFHFILRQLSLGLSDIRKKYYGLPQESLWLHNFYANDNMKFFGYFDF